MTLLTQQECDTWGISELSYRMSLAGGISTLEGGFQIAWIENDCPVECFLCDPDGNAFARFDKDRSVKTASNLSRAELEAIEGMKRLVLKWE